MRTFWKLVLVPALLAAGLSAAPAAAAPVRLTADVPVWATAQNRLGPVSPDATIEVEIVLPWRDPAAVARLVRAVSEPSSPFYGRYLTSSEFRARFAPSPSTVSAVTRWLRAAGLEVGRMPLNRVIVPARGPARLVERVFGTTLSRYRVGSLALRAPDAAPALPAAIARLGATVRGLANTYALLTPGEPLSPELFVNEAEMRADPPPPVPQTPANPADSEPPAAVLYAKPCSAFDGATTDAKTPKAEGVRHPAVTCETSVAALRAAYGIDAMLKAKKDGAGQTIVMVGSHAMRRLPSDLAEWSKRRKLPPLREGQIAQFSYPGAYETPSDPIQTVLRPKVWAQQSAMLIQTMRAIAPGANYLYVGSTSSLDLPNAMLLAVDRHLGNVIVNGWYSASESLVVPSDTAPIDRAAEQAAVTGISLLVASGDLGDNSGFNRTDSGEVDSGAGPRVNNIPIIPPHPSPSFPAHNPGVISVGATSLILGRNGAYVRELGWAKTTRTFADKRWSDPDPGLYRGSGGGLSQVYRQPRYQAGVVPFMLSQRPDSIHGRTVPDIAVNGDAETGMSIGYTMRFPDGSMKYAERRLNADTASTALFGAILAVMSQALDRQLGFVNPALYDMWRYGGRSGFRDIVVYGKLKAGVRTDYLNNVSGATKRVLKTFEQFGSNPPRPGYDTNTGLGTPSRSFFIELLKIVERGPRN